MRHHHGGSRHKRSTYEWWPVSRRERRRERRALRVLDELALTPEQQGRFRRELVEKKQQADKYAAKIDEENAGHTHHRTLEAVHVEKRVHDDSEEELSEVEIEYIQDKLVNNFRPVQPLNGRLVYRSFKLSEDHHRQPHGSSHGSKLADEATLRERLKLYESTESAAANRVISLALLVSACLAALFL